MELVRTKLALAELARTELIRTKLALAELARTELMRTKLALAELAQMELAQTEQLPQAVIAGSCTVAGQLAGV